MNMLRNFVFGAVASCGLALVASAHADDRESQSHHYVYRGGYHQGTSYYQQGYYQNGRFYWTRPHWPNDSAFYYGYDSNYRPPYPVYGYTPGLSVAFGGHPFAVHLLHP
jgi:hypothetical protein